MMTSMYVLSKNYERNILLFITGPLLYHFAEMPNELSIELCYEDVHRIAEEIGFQFLVSVNTHYIYCCCYCV